MDLPPKHGRCQQLLDAWTMQPYVTCVYVPVQATDSTFIRKCDWDGLTSVVAPDGSTGTCPASFIFGGVQFFYSAQQTAAPAPGSGTAECTGKD